MRAQPRSSRAHAALPVSPHSARRARRCRSLDARLVAEFDVRLCRECARLPAHKLLTKSDAKAAFLLSDADLARLRCLKKRAGGYRRDGEVHLFLTSQCAAAAAAKHGGAEELEQQREKRREARLARAAKRRRTAADAAAQDAALGGGGADAAGRDAIAFALLGSGARGGRGTGSRGPQAAVRKLAAAHAPHTHTYSAAPVYDAAQDAHRRVCDTCGAVSFVDVM